MIVSSGYRKNGFDAHGGAVLKKSDMSFWMNLKERTDPRGVAFELGEEVEEVEPDFFELVPTIRELWILNPKCRIYMTEETQQLFHRNKLLVRGWFDSSAEQLAREYHLRFLHLDTELACVGSYWERGNNLITLRFYEDGSAYIHQDCRCQGISAGNTGGGEVSFDLPKDFYRTMTDQEIADQCWGVVRAEIVEKGKLRSVMKQARSKKGFYFDFSEKKVKEKAR